MRKPIRSAPALLAPSIVAATASKGRLKSACRNTLRLILLDTQTVRKVPEATLQSIWSALVRVRHKSVVSDCHSRCQCPHHSVVHRENVQSLFQMQRAERQTQVAVSLVRKSAVIGFFQQGDVNKLSIGRLRCLACAGAPAPPGWNAHSARVFGVVQSCDGIVPIQFCHA